MRFIHVEPVEPEVGNVRLQEAFLLLPKRILNETRWLERAVWTEKYLELTSKEAEVWVPTDWGNV